MYGFRAAIIDIALTMVASTPVVAGLLVGRTGIGWKGAAILLVVGSIFGAAKPFLERMLYRERLR
jgi:hypothetical protein